MENETKEIQHITYSIKEATVDKEKREFTAVITDDTVDRDKEVILPKGLNVKEFKLNPILLLQHNPDIPIGKAIDIKRSGSRWVMTGKLAAEGTVKAADEVWELIKQGILKAISIGFIALERRMPTPEDVKMFGKDVRRIISKAKLLEASVVSVPANQNALIFAAKEMDIDPKDILGEDYIEEVEEKEITIDEQIEEVENISVGETFEKDIEEEIKKIEEEVELKEETKEQIRKVVNQPNYIEMLKYLKDSLIEEMKRQKGELF